MDEPLTFSQWCHESDVEREYQRLCDEMGDLATLLSSYKDYHYSEYLVRFKKEGKRCELFV